MTRTIAWAGLPVSLLWIACGAGTSGAGAGGGAEASAGASGSADSGAGIFDSGAPDASPDCDNLPLTQEQATVLFRALVYQDNPNYNPASVFSVTELQVPGAWEAMGIQLFSGGSVDDYGYVVNERPIVSFSCQLSPDQVECRAPAVRGSTRQHALLHGSSWLGSQLLGARQDLAFRRWHRDPARSRLRAQRPAQPVPARIRRADRGGTGRRHEVQFLERSVGFWVAQGRGWVQSGDGGCDRAADPVHRRGGLVVQPLQREPHQTVDSCYSRKP